ncbi:hypothetical protein [Gordonia sp. AC31]|uniref:hypothetical protein n=1 Tax=Gordonia sp. AC31 TaxID=2962571 RepID=UPI0028823E18|nr:hypothetical protein [Gordonia sp. AC31]MDT0223490.1 hypothetical protein [Gordonia sp. AC31]
MTALNLEQIIAEFIASQAGISVEEAMPQARDLVAAIRDSGYTVIALPEPHGRWAEGPEWVQGANLADRSGWVAWTAEDAGMVMLQRVEPGELTPADAADLGAALIAAAQHATGDTQ